MAPKCQVQRNRYVLRFHENRYAKNAEPVPSNRFVNRFLAVQAEPVRIGSTHCGVDRISHLHHFTLYSLWIGTAGDGQRAWIGCTV